MRRMAAAVATALFVLVPGAQADEVGGSGFDVPQGEWLWGIEGLQRTPVDISGTLGFTFVDYEMKAVSQHIENQGPSFPGSLDDSFVTERDGELEFKNASFSSGFRLAGGIGFWECCVMIEPAIAFLSHHPFGDDRTSKSRRAVDPTDNDEYAFSDVQIKSNWDLVFGPQMTWLIRDDIPVVGPYLGGLPMVFFPFVGVAHQVWKVELAKVDGPRGGGAATVTRERDFREDMFVVGFDLDIPLPGALGPFTHAITFGYKWTDGNEKHDMFEFGDLSELRRFAFKSTEGSRYELRYTVYWNDFESFFKRNIFGPAS